MDKEFLRYVNLTTTIVPNILAIVLASLARKLIGKGWLVAFVVISFVTWAGYQIIPLIYPSRYATWYMYQWYDVLGLVRSFGAACFGLFLLSNYVISRIKLDVKNLLFSFSGRIPRSAFWISVCILFPLGMWLGFAPFATEARGFPRIVIWVVCGGWSILSVWISLAVYTKRWHDCSKSGWMSLILLIPVIGYFWLLGYLGFVRGTHGPNQYGEDPFNTPTTLQTNVTGNA